MSEINLPTSSMIKIGTKTAIDGNSSRKVVELKITAPTVAPTVVDGAVIICIPPELNGMNLVSAQAFNVTPSTSGTPTVQVRNVTDSVDMLSTAITIDINESTSYTAATPSVVDAAHDDVATGDLIALDVDVIGTDTLGLGAILTFELP